MLAVYAAGYVRTRAAAVRFAEQTEARVRSPFALRATGDGPAARTEPVPLTAPAPAAPSTPGATRRRAGKKRLVLAPVEQPSAVPVPAAPEAPVSTASASAQGASADKPEAPAAPAAAAAPQWKDGTYFGWGTSRHGDIQAQVVIEGGRIASATIAQCLTRYSCSVIAKLPPQVAERQSPEVDYVSGATQSTNAFYYAVVEALSKAK